MTTGGNATPGPGKGTTVLWMADVEGAPAAGISLAGDLHAVAQARSWGAGAVQIMAGDPTSWGAPHLSDGVTPAALGEAARAAGVKVYLHSAYLINVATDNPRVRQPSRTLLQRTLTLAAEMGASGVVVHGGHVTENGDAAAGITNWRATVERLDLCAPLLIENTAGGQRAMARLPEQIARLWDAVGDSGVGFCLDTCHAWAAGIPVAESVSIIRSITGRVDLLHANSSRDAFGSARDRHANLPSGTVPLPELLTAVREAGCDAVAETPDPGLREDLDLIAEVLRT